jgi:hypothetical protein
MQVPASMWYISSSSVEVMQRTGQTSTQEASLTPIQGFVITKVKISSNYGQRRVAQPFF